MISCTSIGDGVTKGTHLFHSAFEKVVNFTSPSLHDRFSLSIVSEAVGAGPLCLVIRPFHSLQKIEVKSAAVDEESLVLDGMRISLPQAYPAFFDSSIDFPASMGTDLNGSVHAFEQCLLELSPFNSLAFLLDEERKNHVQGPAAGAWIQRMEQGKDALFSLSLEEGVRFLKGAGPGLTPSGDDFLAGLMIGLHLLQKLYTIDLKRLIQRIYDQAKGTNPFSNTFLYLARQGSVSVKLKNLLRSLVSPIDERAIRKTTGDFLLSGETSGADFGTGLLLCLKRRSQWC